MMRMGTLLAAVVLCGFRLQNAINRLRFPINAAIVLLLFGCAGGGKQAEEAVVLEHRMVDLGDRYLGGGGPIVWCGGDVVGLDLHPAAEHPFFVLSKDGSFYQSGNKGRGPGEFLMPLSIQSTGEKTVGVLDVQTRKYSEFGIPTEGKLPKVEKEVNLTLSVDRMVKTAFGQLVCLSSFEETMFSLADSSGVPIASFFEYPYRDQAESRFRSRGMAYQGTLSINPAKTKIVYSSFSGEILHFYSVGQDTMSVITKIENSWPDYSERDIGEFKGVEFDADSLLGYISTSATNDFVYAVYSGKTVREQIETKRSNDEGTTLRVFDWNGVQVAEYGLDTPCGHICVSDDDKTMWAVTTAPDGEIALASFDLPNI